MLKKRLIGLVTVRNGWAVQSFGYRRYLPLGRPECLIENLDRWGADEILVQVIDRSTGDQGPDFDLLARLGRLGLETPLIYGGGIATADQAVRAIQSGADRVTVDQVLHRAPDEVRRMSARLGAQALIAAVPVRFADGVLRRDYRAGQCLPFGDGVPALIAERVVSELMLIDWQNEGGLSGFEPERLEELPCPEVPLILFGGFTDPAL
ncbi:MAG TPA: HisA/HisF-related TIM barrel protein, partial [Methyloversatilis sp.]